MNTKNAPIAITVRAIINAPVQKAWEYGPIPGILFTGTSHLSTGVLPRAENDLRVGGKFMSRMEARMGAWASIFRKYTWVEQQKRIELTLDDGRKVQVLFNPEGDKTEVTEIFEAEQENPVELQKTGWQAIMDNFKKYVEAS